MLKYQIFWVVFCVRGQLCPYDDIEEGCIDGLVEQALPKAMGLHVEIIDNTQFPYMVSIQERQEDKQCYKHFCGGTMIAPNLVLTAAHCMDDIKEIQPQKNFSIGIIGYLVFWPKSGDYFVAISPRCRHLENKLYGRMAINEIYIYLDYKKRHGALHNDVAVLQLVGKKGSFYKGPLVQLVDPSTQISAIRKPLKTMGYGQAREEPDPMNPLYTVYPLHGGDLSYLEYQKCKDILIQREDNISAIELDYTTMVCFYNPNADTCDGDSGGPLILGDIQVGIVSWGPGSQCQSVGKEQTPTIFVRLPRYVTWIRNIISMHGCYRLGLCERRPIQFDGDCGSTEALQCDADALLAFKYSVSGGGSLLSSWKGTDPCKWDYVACNRVNGTQKRVAQLNLDFSEHQNNNDINLKYTLFAQLVPEFSKMRFLSELKLSRQNITGKFLDEYSVLDKLTYFKVHRTQVTGTLPKTYSTWNEIQQFEGNFNSITGTIPGEWSRWANLEKLYVTANKLSGTIPEEFSIWIKCVTFLVGENRLSGTIPPAFSTLERLTSLAFHRNNFSGTFPSEYSTMSLLEQFICEVDQFTGTLPPQYSTWQKLINLSVYDNKLSKTFPPQYSTMTKIEELDAGKNQFTGTLPPQYSTWQYIQKILIYQNKILGTLPSQYSAMVLMNTIDVGRNNLLSTLPPQYSTWKDCRYFQLYEGLLIGSLPAEYSTMITIDMLLLQENLLTGTLPREYSTWGLSTIFLVEDNKLSSTLPPEYSTMFMMQQFIVSYNGISGRLPFEYSNMAYLQKFEARNTKLESKIPDVWSVTGAFGNIDI